MYIISSSIISSPIAHQRRPMIESVRAGARKEEVNYKSLAVAVQSQTVVIMSFNERSLD